MTACQYIGTSQLACDGRGTRKEAAREETKKTNQKITRDRGVHSDWAFACFASRTSEAGRVKAKTTQALKEGAEDDL